jgi:hypothetical protein
VAELLLILYLEHASQHTADERAFLSGNKNDFGGATAAGAELRSNGVKVLSRSAHALAWLASRPGASDPS